MERRAQGTQLFEADVQPTVSPHISIEEASSHKDLAGRIVYYIQAGSTRVGWISPDQDGIAFGWCGEINFADLDKIVLTDLPELLTGGKHRLSSDSIGENQTVKFEFLSNDEYCQMLLNNPKDLERYREILRNPNNISYARYEIVDTSVTPAVCYTFTAQNPITTRGHKRNHSELGIKIKSGVAWTEAFASWVLKTGTHLSPEFKSSDPKELANVLSSVR